METSKRSDLSKKMGHRAFRRVKHVYRYKNSHHHCIFRYCLLSARARCMTWRDIAKPVNYVRSKDAHKQLR